jgi:hypothetical protein
MGKSTEYNSSVRTKRKEYRDRHERQQEERFKTKAKLRKEFVGILDVIVRPDDVDMRSFCGTEAELVYAIEQLYANDGRLGLQDRNWIKQVVS